MEDKSIYFIEAQKRIKNIMANPDYSTEINGTAATLDLFTRSNDYLVTSLKWQMKLEKSSKPFTVAGVDVKKLAAEDFSMTASVMGSYGEKISNSELIGLKEYTFSNLFKLPVVDQLAACNKILGLITVHETPLVGYKINDTFTTYLVDLAKKLDDLTKLPADVISQRANDNIQYGDHENQVKKFYEKEMDPYMKIYRKFNMDLFLAYLAARRVRHHHLKRKSKQVDPETSTGILELLVLFKATMDAAAGVSFVVATLNISDTTDEDGELYVDELAPGTYHGKLSMDGYKDVEFDFTIEARKTCELQFLMEAV